MGLIARLRASIPSQLWYTLFVLASTRFALAVIGVSSRTLLMPLIGEQYVWNYSENPWLDIWGVFDSGWYLSIAAQGYQAELSTRATTLGQANYNFFPLYPLLIRSLAVLTRDRYLAGIALSNICLFLACISLYKLVRLESGHETALASIRYLLIFPVSFILSGVFTESLFLLLAIMCFYYAKRSRWPLVGISGFLLALTRFVAILAFVPLLYEYVCQKDFKVRRFRPDMLFLMLIPLGLFVFALHNYLLTGDYLATVHIPQTGWGHEVTNPLQFLMENLRGDSVLFRFEAWFTIALLILLKVFYRRIGFAYWLLAMSALLFPLATTHPSMPRYSVVIFPIYVLLAKLAKNKWTDQMMTMASCLLQGWLMVFWSNGFTLVV